MGLYRNERAHPFGFKCEEIEERSSGDMLVTTGDHFGRTGGRFAKYGAQKSSLYYKPTSTFTQ